LGAMGCGAVAGIRQHQEASIVHSSGRSVHSEPTSELVIAGMNAADFCQQANPGDSDTDAILQRSIDQLSSDVFGFPFSLSIAIPSVVDTPLVGISQGFTKLTGYTREEIVGRNCRFLLQGVPQEDINMDTRYAARRYCRMAHLRNLTSMAHSLFIQRNRRKNGELFWNFFMLSVVPSSDTTFVVGLQLDLGSELVDPMGPQSADTIAASLDEHRKRLVLVQAAMFGPSVPNSLPDPEEESLSEARPFPGSEHDLMVCTVFSEDAEVSKTIAQHVNLAEEVKSWLVQAEASCGNYQQAGTLPWAAWPTSRLALLDGGATVLRLEADTLPTGAVAMSVFPALVKDCARSFRLRIDAVSDHWKHGVIEGTWLPSMGFTEMSPAVTDDLGGLPNHIEDIQQSVTLRGDGQLFKVRDTIKCSATREELGLEASSYQACAGDTLECTWVPGCMTIRANGKVILEVRHQMIHDPPEHAVYGIVDCCFAVCKLTLLSQGPI